MACVTAVEARQKEVDAILQRLNIIGERTENVTRRIREATDRVLGEEPPTPANVSIPCLPASGTFGVLNNGCGALEETLSNAERYLQRLEGAI